MPSQPNTSGSPDGLGLQDSFSSSYIKAPIPVHLDHAISQYTSSLATHDPWTPLCNGSPRNHSAIVQGVDGLGDDPKAC
ncbi:hypothetical protein ABW20_dc0100611 [Dactylellina cionopaga]|nr:hypothetical protein ABW20_dc0100611 [Dactylellina cionopaga]